jgi:hypothetical protein
LYQTRTNLVVLLALVAVVEHLINRDSAAPAWTYGSESFRKLADERTGRLLVEGKATVPDLAQIREPDADVQANPTGRSIRSGRSWGLLK